MTMFTSCDLMQRSLILRKAIGIMRGLVLLFNPPVSLSDILYARTGFFLVRLEKNSRGTKTQEIVNSRKKLKLKQKNQFSGIFGCKNKTNILKICKIYLKICQNSSFTGGKIAFYHPKISCSKPKTPEIKRFSRFSPTTQEKTQNSRKKLKTQGENSVFRHFSSQ